MYKVLKAFPLAGESLHPTALAVDTIVSIPDDLVPGLTAEGYIQDATDEEVEAAATGAIIVREPVEIPADWADQTAFKKRELAAAISGGAVANKKTAEAIIKAEIEARANAEA